MTPDEFKALRHDLGLSVVQMADALGLGGERAATTLREIENGARTPHGSTVKLAERLRADLTASHAEK